MSTPGDSEPLLEPTTSSNDGAAPGTSAIVRGRSSARTTRSPNSLLPPPDSARTSPAGEEASSANPEEREHVRHRRRKHSKTGVEGGKTKTHTAWDGFSTVSFRKEMQDDVERANELFADPDRSVVSRIWWVRDKKVG